jgi:hypothetical protein
VAANGDVTKATYLNAPLTVLSYAYDTRDRMTQFAGGGKWTNDKLTVSTDISYTKATGSVVFNSGFTGATIPRFSVDNTAFVPGSSANGYDLLSQSNTNFQFLLYQGTQNKADQFAGTLDASYAVDSGFLKSIDVGFPMATARRSPTRPASSCSAARRARRRPRSWQPIRRATSSASLRAARRFFPTTRHSRAAAARPSERSADRAGL